MKTLIRIAIISVVFLVSSTVSYGCWCAPPDVKEAFDKSRAVFIGEVVEIIPPRSTKPDEAFRDRAATIKFNVEKAWKGVSWGETEVRTLMPEICVYPLRRGEKYLVYASLAHPGEWPVGELVISICNRTALIPKNPVERSPFGRTSFDPTDGSADIRILDNIFILMRSSPKYPKYPKLDFFNFK